MSVRIHALQTVCRDKVDLLCSYVHVIEQCTSIIVNPHCNGPSMLCICLAELISELISSFVVCIHVVGGVSSFCAIRTTAGQPWLPRLAALLCNRR
jgi:hypothetical protein